MFPSSIKKILSDLLFVLVNNGPLLYLSPSDSYVCTFIVWTQVTGAPGLVIAVGMVRLMVAWCCSFVVSILALSRPSSISSNIASSFKSL